MIRLTNVSYLCIAISTYVLLNIIGAGQCYGEDKTLKNHLIKEYTSPKGNIIVRHYVDGYEICPDGDIWLYSKKNPSKKALLFSYERDADVLISPDEKWLVINYRAGCNVTDANLYKQIKDLKYEYVTSLNDFAWDLFRVTHKQYKIPDFFHNYAEAVLWSSDSKSVMIEIYGHDDISPKKLEPWYCIYDLTTGKMTLDFNRIFNRDTYHPNGEAKGRELFTY
ncbi:hypothetical protein [Candidatus Magnetominusculus dajiuhuensis]|uniref:hypothetical protein n=1 Tax=Candidatus Magnetominusculus dajiuhuensis TaxID=3137712 RepID=UPI003B43D52F